jgi:OmpA-OmpF porin, OOP family
MRSGCHRRRPYLGVVALIVLALPVVGCTKETQQAIIHIGVTATANEPAPGLAPEAEARLRAAMTAGETDLFVYQSKLNAASLMFKRDISVRRGGPKGKLEHDEDRKTAGIKKTLSGLNDELAQVTGDSGQLDLFGLLGDLGRVPGPAVLILHSSGLQTTGELDLTRFGSDIDVAATIDALPADALPDLTGKQVLFTGLGQVAGPQEPLREPMRRAVEDLWLGVCRKFHAAECASDPSPVATAGPASTVPVPVVPVPAADLRVVPGPRGGQDEPGVPEEVEVRLPCAVLFEPNTDVLADGAQDELRRLLPHFGPGTTATAIGHTATYGPRDSSIDLSRGRSRKVVDILTGLGVSPAAFTTVDGVGFDEPIVPDLDGNGKLIPEAAEKNRTVVLTLFNPAR